MRSKVDQWQYPYRQPPPSGLRQSKEFFPHFFNRYFPNDECRLVIDSVLNNETSQPVFHFPMHMSKLEISNYLRNVYGLENIISVDTKNFRGRYYKNEVGAIRNLPDYKEATVTLDAPVVVDFKQLKGTEDTPDNKKLA
jgi:large subunit ribosomal protein L23